MEIARTVYRLAFLVLLLVVANGCTSTPPGTSASAATRGGAPRVAWAGMSPEERDRTATADIESSDRFAAPRCRWLKYGTWIHPWPAESSLYDAATDVGYIEMEEVGTENRTGNPEPVWRITLTEAGKTAAADCKGGGSNNVWGVPVSRRKLLSAKYLGENDLYSGLTTFQVEYEWIPTNVGDLVKFHLTDKMAVEEGKFRTRVWLRRLKNDWSVERIDEMGAQRLE